MMKKILFTICTLCFAGFFAQAAETKALTFKELPVKQATNQWAVAISKAKEEKGLAKPEKGKYQTYSVEVKKIGGDAAAAEIHLFRNHPHSATKFSLFGKRHQSDDNEEAISLAKSLNKGLPVRYNNILLAEKATELEVDIIWTEKGSEGRALKETFTFTGNDRK